MNRQEFSARARQTLEALASSGVFWWSVAIALGIVNVLPRRFVMNPDGISYMNLASLYQHGDWVSAINGYWSPLYPLLIAATFRLVPTSPYFESTIVHALNLVFYLATFAAFRFFLSELRASQDQRKNEADDGSNLSFGSVAEVACAYSLFFWATLVLIGLALVTPDMALASLVFVAAGVTIRLKREGSVAGYVGLGAIVGLAYLTKAVMFPIGIVMCLCCALPASVAAAAKRTVLALVGFLLVASPQLVAMSRLSGHVSYGESGTVAYANEVNHISKMWVGEPAGSGTPVHAMRRTSTNPAAYDFSTSNVGFSYPVSDELAYWMEGVRPDFSMGEQLRVTRQIMNWYVFVFDVLIFAALALYLLSKHRIKLRYAALIATALATFAIYALVYSETRYLGAWAVVLFLCFAGSIELGPSAIRGAKAILAAVALFYGMSFLNLSRNAVVNAITLYRSQSPHAQFETAVDLAKLGVRRGSRVGAIGYAFNSYWARLAGVQIAMQLPDEKAYSSATDSMKANIITTFRAAGAVAVVSTGKPAVRAGENWMPLGPAGYWVLILSPR